MKYYVTNNSDESIGGDFDNLKTAMKYVTDNPGYTLHRYQPVMNSRYYGLSEPSEYWDIGDNYWYAD